MMKYLFGLIGWIGLLTACSSINYLSIDTFNPAEVTVPSSANKVLIVNHAVPQPADWGYSYTVSGKVKATQGAKADSALVDFCQSLGEAMVAEEFFQDVLLYHEPTRADQHPEYDLKMTAQQVDSLCEVAGADLLLSLDRLLFESSREDTDLGGGFTVGEVKVRMAGVIRAYLPGRAAPLATIQLVDSVAWEQSAELPPILNELLPSSEEALRTAGRYLGAKASVNFVPHWQRETRWYFSTSGAVWKEAAAYATNERWEKAEERWNRIYQTSKGWKSRAQVASNLALCAEMKGDLQQAHEWASISYELFKQKAGEEDQQAQLLELYVKALTERVRANQKLDVQIGKQ